MGRKAKELIRHGSWELRVRRGEERVRRFQLLGGAITIGRSSDCDVVLPSASVSRTHARLEISGDAFSITDLGSRNGLEVNGSRITPESSEALSPGDHIRIDVYVLTIMESQSDDEESTKGQAPSLQRLLKATRGAVEIGPEGRGETAEPAPDRRRGPAGGRKSRSPLGPQGATDPRVKAPGHDGVQSVVLLFLDIVDSTALTEQLGDEGFRRRSRKLDQRLRALIADQHGRPVEGKVLGDGILAIFTAAKHAIACALRCNGEAEEVGLQLHLGLHAGDVIQDGGNVYGGAVNIAARVASASAPGEVLVSETVRALSRTSTEVAFEDRGTHTLKGVAEAQRLFAVRTRSG